MDFERPEERIGDGSFLLFLKTRGLDEQFSLEPLSEILVRHGLFCRVNHDSFGRSFTRFEFQTDFSETKTEWH